MKGRTIDATVGSPGRIVLKMAIPTMAGSVFQNLYSVVDTVVVGQFVGIDALAAVGNTGWIIFMVQGILMGIFQAVGICISDRFGAKDERGIRRAVAGLVVLAAVQAVVLTALSQLAILPIFHLLQFPAEILADAEVYLRIYLGNLPVIIAYSAMENLLRALGDTRTPFFAVVAGALTNVALDLLFVAGFGTGVAGAAAATVISQVISVLVCLPVILKMRFCLPAAADFRQNGKMLGRELKLGAPLGLQNTITAIGGLFVTYAINGYSVNFIAAFNATQRLYGLLEMSGIAVGYAFSVFVSQNMGARQYARVHQSTKSTFLISMALSAGIAVLLGATGRAVLSLFIDSSDREVYLEVLDIACRYLRIMCIWLPVLYMLHTFRSGLNGLSDTMTPMLSGIIEFLARVVMTTVAVNWWAQNAVMHAETTAWAGAAALLTTVYLLRLRRIPCRNEPRPQGGDNDEERRRMNEMAQKQ